MCYVKLKEGFLKRRFLIVYNMDTSKKNTESTNLERAGLLLFIAGVLIFMSIITGEIFYPREYSYSTRDNTISDLGVTKFSDSIITQPSATIFNTTMIITGIMILIAIYFVHMNYKKYFVSIPLTLFGLGVLGVGVFPGNITPWHRLFAMITFVFGGVGTIASCKIVRSPLRYVFIVLGIISLVSLFIGGFMQAFIPFLGIGGTERWVAYPIVFWMLGFGSYILGIRGR